MTVRVWLRAWLWLYNWVNTWSCIMCVAVRARATHNIPDRCTQHTISQHNKRKCCAILLHVGYNSFPLVISPKITDLMNNQPWFSCEWKVIQSHGKMIWNIFSPNQVHITWLQSRRIEAFTIYIWPHKCRIMPAYLCDRTHGPESKTNSLGK